MAALTRFRFWVTVSSCGTQRPFSHFLPEIPITLKQNGIPTFCAQDFVDCLQSAVEFPGQYARSHRRILLDRVDDTHPIDSPRPAKALLIVDGQISASEFRVPFLSHAFACKICSMDFIGDRYSLRSVCAFQKLVPQELPYIDPCGVHFLKTIYALCIKMTPEKRAITRRKQKLDQILNRGVIRHFPEI